MTDWIEWNGGVRPVPGNTQVDIRFRDMFAIHDTSASDWVWDHHFGDDDIIAYRVRAPWADTMADKLRAAGYIVTKPRSIDDIEPLRRALVDGETYYVPSITNESTIKARHWNELLYSSMLLRRGLCYATEEDAKIAARAMIEMKGGEV